MFPTTALLAALLTSSPGIQLTDSVEARHVELSAPQMELELSALDRSRPSRVGSTILLAVGAPFFIAGTVGVVYGSTLLGVSFGVAAGVGSLFLGIAPYFLIAAGALLGVIPGAIMLFIGIKTALLRKSNVERTQILANRLDAIQAVRASNTPATMQTLFTF